MNNGVYIQGQSSTKSSHTSSSPLTLPLNVFKYRKSPVNRGPSQLHRGRTWCPLLFHLHFSLLCSQSFHPCSVASKEVTRSSLVHFFLSDSCLSFAVHVALLFCVCFVISADFLEVPSCFY